MENFGNSQMGEIEFGLIFNRKIDDICFTCCARFFYWQIIVKKNGSDFKLEFVHEICKIRKNWAPLGGNVTQNVDFQTGKVGLQRPKMLNKHEFKKKTKTNDHILKHFPRCARRFQLSVARGDLSENVDFR